MHSVWGKIKLLITVKVLFKKPLTPVHTMAFLAPSLEAAFLVLWSVRHCKKDNSELYMQLQFCVCALRLCFDYGPMNKDINVNNFSYGEAEVSLEHSIQALVQPLLFTSLIPESTNKTCGSVPVTLSPAVLRMPAVCRLPHMTARSVLQG